MMQLRIPGNPLITLMMCPLSTSIGKEGGNLKRTFPRGDSDVIVKIPLTIPALLWWFFAAFPPVKLSYNNIIIRHTYLYRVCDTINKHWDSFSVVLCLPLRLAYRLTEHTVLLPSIL